MVIRFISRWMKRFPCIVYKHFFLTKKSRFFLGDQEKDKKNYKKIVLKARALWSALFFLSFDTIYGNWISRHQNKEPTHTQKSPSLSTNVSSILNAEWNAADSVTKREKNQFFFSPSLTLIYTVLFCRCVFFLFLFPKSILKEKKCEPGKKDQP